MDIADWYDTFPVTRDETAPGVFALPESHSRHTRQLNM